MSAMPVIGIIGGSGFDSPEILTDLQKIKKHTPYGAPSDLLTIGSIEGVKCIIIPRHGDSHRFNPSLVNYRANIWALKDCGVTHIVAPTACGSLRIEIKPEEVVFIDQFIDRTTKRHQTFYEGHEVCHIPMNNPFCAKLRNVLSKSSDTLKIPHHKKGTIITIEGPRFSTKAESMMFRSWGADVINMTTVPEVVLAREAGICYASIAMSTDYDCWHESEESVTLPIILDRMKNNAKNVKNLLLHTIPKINWDSCECMRAVETSRM